MPEPGGGAGGRRRIRAEQRESPPPAAPSGIRRLLRPAEALRREALSLDAADPNGLLAMAGGLYMYAVEESGKALLSESLPEKGNIISVRRQATFDSRKNLETAHKALSKECWPTADGYSDPTYSDPIYFDTGTTFNAGFPARLSMLCLDMDRNGELVESIPASVELLEDALPAMGRVAKKWDANGRTAGMGGGEARSGREAT